MRDVRDRAGISRLVDEMRHDVMCDAAGQPCHGLAAAIPCEDFGTKSNYP
jgi:hypothetical protein